MGTWTHGELIALSGLAFTVMGAGAALYIRHDRMLSELSSRVSTMWEIHMEDAKQALKQRGFVKQNSPLRAIKKRLDEHGGPDMTLYPIFESMLKKGLPHDNADLLILVRKSVGEDIIAQRATKLELSTMQYLYFWVVTLREAERDGLDALKKVLEI